MKAALLPTLSTTRTSTYLTPRHGHLNSNLKPNQTKHKQLPGVSEDTARTIISSLLHTLAFLQDQHIAHRDVKPENILLRAPLLPPPSSSSDNSGGGGNSNTSSSSSSSAKSSLVLESDVVLCDFGFATRCSGRSLSNVCGSTAYMAPEVSSVVRGGECCERRVREGTWR
jgi:serine/threonine protein kinase